jgi:hypothetical protein
LVQLDRLHANRFQVLWASMPSHETIGTTLFKTRKYQCRSQ